MSIENDHIEIVSSSAFAKKAKTNMFDEAEKVSVLMNIAINHPECHKAQEDARLLQTVSRKIQTVSADLKELILKYAMVGQPDATTMAREVDLDGSLWQVIDFEMEIVSCVGRAPSLDKNDAEGNKLFSEFADAKIGYCFLCECIRDCHQDGQELP